MKKLLLSASALMLALGASAQLSASGKGFFVDNTSASSNCYLNNLPSNAGIMAHGGNFEQGPNYILTGGDSYYLKATTIGAGSNPVWFGLPVTTGSGASATCGSANGANQSVDLTNDGKVRIVAKANAIGDTLEFFLGGEGQWSPANSTYNTLAASGKTDIIAYLVFTKASTYETFEIDYSTLDATAWTNWAGRNKVQSIGFRTPNAGTEFWVQKVAIGDEYDKILNSTSSVATSSVSVYPNPASAVVNVNVGSASNATVQLTDVTGKVVASVSGVSGTTAINTSNVPAGLYVVSVTSASGVVTSKVVVK